ncbi:23S rRNA (adenine(2503)-C(2))-methyltransferase RlmN [Alkaliphilus crotonatoxidans]
MVDLLSLTKEELMEFIVALGEKKFRGKQIFQWLHRGVQSFDEMTNISKALRDQLKEKAHINEIKIETKLVSRTDGTTKYLFLLEDRNIIEGVIMEYKHGLTACISSQVGCGMGCSFCASTKGGLVRNLTAGEMIGQLLTMEADLGKRISNIVMMGSGEPLHNFKEMTRFLKNVNDEDGLNIGNRHITISTCGLVPEIKALADLKIPINLAISLHAATDEKRQKMMPIAQKYSIYDIIEACQYYLKKNNRRITFEYALIDGENDQEEDARILAYLLKGLLCHVNLIPVNQVDESPYRKSHQDRIKVFAGILKGAGIETTLRRELGADIQAACGQLRNRYMKGQEVIR